MGSVAFAGLLALLVAAAVVVLGSDRLDRAGDAGAGLAASSGPPASAIGGGPPAEAPPTPQPHDWGRIPSEAVVALNLRKPPRSGLLVDATSGRVLWRHEPERRLPIASVTKMMTALLVAERTTPREPVAITREALAYTGSGVGLLPKGKRAQAETLLYGLLLPSGNDAAIALAQHVAGSVPRFVRMMNARARELGLSCTRFASPSGIVDRGNWSCAPDLALLAQELLRVPRLARVVRTPLAVMPLPVRGGRVWLANHNPLLRAGYRGADGVKTGYTDAAGRCFVASATRGRTRLIAVLLGSPDPGKQAARLLDAGFAALANSPAHN
ncbi:D-alanyl-D-alanine carboxypeptidase family protein [Conexibacter stalactiti]|uniref:D-alanyl-D-alanine carboxypeptidase family protein n=1 Tax=Conexibacter stalactiti TaxID=1940611 RepID=A0ABU4HWB6_9ACTN|nr:D-alanyl-D-alanine carboxypeptidase family protein [Conexibacter stalactiti]MDW5597593.1 D-alanyl-D-alanine carboxypeptidase family protein [Conexibacter stalactiti]MEC5038235.1 D-alanyl-D-alanine carboxypeptidase family protein [Conexibacter stalactiti]